MPYDRMDWHSGGEFPEGLPVENAGTHIGMFLAWAIHRGLEGRLHAEHSPSGLADVRGRRMTGREFLIRFCDEKFWDQDLNDEGNAFAAEYYESEKYWRDYRKLFRGEGPTVYHVADTWENFERVRAMLDRRFETWRKGRNRPRPARKSTSLLAGPGLDRGTGEIRFEDPLLSIGPALSRAEFLVSDAGKSAEVFTRNEPYCSWKLAGGRCAGTIFGVVLWFRGEKLWRVQLWDADPRFGTGWEDATAARGREQAASHESWLTAMLGDKRSFRWGKVSVALDERSGDGGIFLEYR